MATHSRLPILLAAAAALLVACNGSSRGRETGGETEDAAPEAVDAGRRDAAPPAPDASTVAPDGSPEASACNPVTQQGCAEGEKCSWIVAQVAPTFLGQTACVRDGNVPLGGACTDLCIPRGSVVIGPVCGEENAPDPTANPPIIGT